MTEMSTKPLQQQITLICTQHIHVFMFVFNPIEISKSDLQIYMYASYRMCVCGSLHACLSMYACMCYLCIYVYHRAHMETQTNCGALLALTP